MPAEVEDTLFLPGLSPVAGKELDVRFDGDDVSSDGGLLVLREIDRKIGVADALAPCPRDDRNPAFVRHSYARYDPGENSKTAGLSSRFGWVRHGDSGAFNFGLG